MSRILGHTLVDNRPGFGGNPMGEHFIPSIVQNMSVAPSLVSAAESTPSGLGGPNNVIYQYISLNQTNEIVHADKERSIMLTIRTQRSSVWTMG